MGWVGELNEQICFECGCQLIVILEDPKINLKILCTWANSKLGQLRNVPKCVIEYFQMFPVAVRIKASSPQQLFPVVVF